MLAEFRKYIYSNSEERNNVVSDIIRNVAKQEGCTEEYAAECYKTKANNAVGYEIFEEIERTEGKRLYQKVCESFAEKMWKNESCLDIKCMGKCPYSDICQKSYFIIDGIKYCYGQLITRTDIKNEKILLNKIKNKEISSAILYNRKGKCLIDLTDPFANEKKKSDNEQLISSHFFQYQMHIWWFGEKFDTHQSGLIKINGGKAIKKYINMIDPAAKI